MQEFYQTLFNRRDVRGEFTSQPVPDEVLARLLVAAHHAPSVGLSQPWNFIVVRHAAVKKRVHDAFSRANEEAAERFESERRDHYRTLKLAGILEAPINLCVTCHRERGGDVVLGRTHQRDMDLYSTVCAVQNLWLSARAENIGVGWVSIIDPGELADILVLPQGVVPVAYLCLGYVKFFRDSPELEQRGWEKRLSLEGLVFEDEWGGAINGSPLEKAVLEAQDWPKRFRQRAQEKIPDPGQDPGESDQ